MKTLRLFSLLLFLVATSLSFLQANNQKRGNSRRQVVITEQKWKNHYKRSSPFIPIDAYIVDNNCIEAVFLGDDDFPSTFQIRDSHGTLVYEDVTYQSEESYKIDLMGLVPGKYTLIYSDQHMELSGDFEKE